MNGRPHKPTPERKVVTLDAKANKTITGTPAAVSLPSPHIVHSDVLENEMQNRLHQFKSAKIALQGEMEGRERDYQTAAAELAAKHEALKVDLLRRIDDMTKGEMAICAALDVLTTKQAA